LREGLSAKGCMSSCVHKWVHVTYYTLPGIISYASALKLSLSHPLGKVNLWNASKTEAHFMIRKSLAFVIFDTWKSENTRKHNPTKEKALHKSIHHQRTAHQGAILNVSLRECHLLRIKCEWCHLESFSKMVLYWAWTAAPPKGVDTYIYMHAYKHTL